MSLRNFFLVGGLSLGCIFFVTGIAEADESKTDNFQIKTDVINSGGEDVSKSTNYLLSDSIGEAIIGATASNTTQLNSGYRQGAESISLACSSDVNTGSGASGIHTGSGTCTIHSESGYNLGWAVLTGSGGTNTGSLISENNDTIPSYTPAVADTPETWAVAASAAEWGGRLSSRSSDTSVEWGTDGSSEKWLNIATSNRTIITRQDATPIDGSLAIVEFQVEIGASKLQTTGTYLTTVTFTVVTY